MDGVSEDEQKVSQEAIQKTIDSSIEGLEKIAQSKEKELLSI
jgi:ribosome recycling factor